MRIIQNHTHNFFVDTNFSGIGKKIEKREDRRDPYTKKSSSLYCYLLSRILTLHFGFDLSYLKLHSLLQFLSQNHLCPRQSMKTPPLWWYFLSQRVGPAWSSSRHSPGFLSQTISRLVSHQLLHRTIQKRC